MVFRKMRASALICAYGKTIKQEEQFSWIRETFTHFIVGQPSPDIVGARELFNATIARQLAPSHHSNILQDALQAVYYPALRIFRRMQNARLEKEHKV